MNGIYEEGIEKRISELERRIYKLELDATIAKNVAAFRKFLLIQELKLCGFSLMLLGGFYLLARYMP